MGGNRETGENSSTLHGLRLTEKTEQTLIDTGIHGDDGEERERKRERALLR